MRITSRLRRGEGQTICKGCYEKNSHLPEIQRSVGSRHWDCMMYDVSINEEPYGILCGDCLSDLIKKKIGMEATNNDV